MEPGPSDRDDDGTAAVRRSIERATRLALGAISAATDAGARVVAPPAGDQTSGPEPEGDASTGDVVVGAALELQRRLLDASERAGDLLGRAAPMTRRLSRLPIVRGVSDAIERRVDELGTRGAAERRASQELVSSTFDETVAEAARSEVLERTVEEVMGELLPSVLEAALPDVMDQIAKRPELMVPMIEAILDPMLDVALPEVMAKLNQEPEVVRELVLGQSVSIAGEMAEAVRSRGVDADDIAERVARRLTFRRPRPELPRAPRALSAGAQVTATPRSHGGNGDDRNG